MTDSETWFSPARLWVRFALILTYALLPLGLIAFAQTRSLESEVRARSEAALLGTTLRAAQAETGLILKARGAMASLALAIPEVLDDGAACIDLMKRMAILEPAAVFVGFIPFNGIMTCSSVGKVHDFSKNPFFLKMRDLRVPSFVVNPNGPIAKASVLGILDPVFDKSGAYVGLAGMSLPHRLLKDLQFGSLMPVEGTATPVVFWTFDGEGNLLSSNIDLADAATRVPKDMPIGQFIKSEGQVLTGVSKSGLSQIYAVVPIVAGELYLMSSWHPEEQVDFNGFAVWSYAPPLLMWLAGLIVAGWAAERLVTRHVRTLNRAIVGFAKGDRKLQEIDLKGAPLELDQLASAYSAMTESITRSEAELEDSLHQKEALLREVHHRVKNNLQLISSIMNIQLRSTKTVEAKTLMKNLQERIMSLATVHRSLYQSDKVADVGARDLFPSIVRQIMSLSSGAEKPFDTQLDIDDLRLVPDQAVPLALLLAEALTNVVKHGNATRDHPGHLQVRLKRSGDSDAMMELINSFRAREPKISTQVPHDAGIGTQLITAFVRQLGGTQESGILGETYFLRVRFNVASRSEPDIGQPDPDPEFASVNATPS